MSEQNPFDKNPFDKNPFESNPFTNNPSNQDSSKVGGYEQPSFKHASFSDDGSKENLFQSKSSSQNPFHNQSSQQRPFGFSSFSKQAKSSQDDEVKTAEFKREAKEEAKKIKKNLVKGFQRTSLFLVILVVALIALLNSAYIVHEGEFAYLTQFGAIVQVTDQAGLKWKIPFIQSVSTFTKKIQNYDISASEVLTADKKAMIVDSYALWKIEDIATFYQTIGNIPAVESRIDATVFSVIKNIMGNMPQSEIISDEDSTRDNLNDMITERVESTLKHYGIDVLRVEINRYDLPPDNLNAVYDRMISERQQMAASFKADGEYQATKIRNDTDKEANIILSEAQAQAEKLLGEGESRYMQTLSDFYNDQEKADFYLFLLRLESLKESITGSNKTIILGPESPLAKLLTGAEAGQIYQKVEEKGDTTGFKTKDTEEKLAESIGKKEPDKETEPSKPTESEPTKEWASESIESNHTEPSNSTEASISGEDKHD